MAIRQDTLVGGVVHRVAYHPAAIVLVSVLVLVAQSYLGHKLPLMAVVDLPLLTVVYFSIVLRSPMTGTLGGTALGLAQDAMGGHALGVNGMLKAIIGYTAASLGVRLDVENMLSRMLLAAVFTVANSVIGYVMVTRLEGLELQWLWLHEASRVLANGLIAAPLYWTLDRLRRRD
jgi:rod shape-determining protein MreD